MTDAPLLLVFRRDLRLADHPALHAAAATGRPVLPVFIHDEVVDATPVAPRWRWGLGIAAFAGTLEGIGSRLILRRGRAVEVLKALVAETGATTVWWTRCYDPGSVARDRDVKEVLEAQGLEAGSHPGHLLFEPWSVETKTGGPFRVYTPYWRAVKDRDPGDVLAAPASLRAPDAWPASDDLDAWGMGAAMDRGAAIVRPHARVGAQAAQDRLADFMDTRIAAYKDARNIPGTPGTSGMSENLTYGEIGIRACWHAGWAAVEAGRAGAEHYVKELVWRDFAYHLLYHTPRLLTGNWRPEWDAFPWAEDAAAPEVTAWQRGRTGMPFVDAAMREMYVTGTMHNRARMIVASYLTKHLMTHWRIGMHWFEDHLIDWDPANNAMGWQWSAGSGPDATPFFRVFNPESQLDKFDPDRAYVDRWIAEGQGDPHADALAYFDAIPRDWSMAASDAYAKEPLVTAADGRARALAAYEARNF